jgi:sugar-phosphatase
VEIRYIACSDPLVPSRSTLQDKVTDSARSARILISGSRSQTKVGSLDVVRAFLFDIDGTLVDSSRIVERVWRQVAAAFGADATAILDACHGRRDTEVVGDFFGAADAEKVLARITALEADAIDGVAAVPGAAKLLSILQDHQWAAVTSGGRQLMVARLHAADLPVPRVLIAAENVEHGKPNPEGYLAAARGLGVSPAECLVVEDSPAGILAGKSAGATVAAVTTTHSAQALAAADLVLPDLSELQSALAGL